MESALFAAYEERFRLLFRDLLFVLESEVEDNAKEYFSKRLERLDHAYAIARETMFPQDYRKDILP